ncbi:hypothetical protein L1887_28190 [Cichorium endivia]|nr:hypothetical protein L1887_28190 [Cichorium endivia]
MNRRLSSTKDVDMNRRFLAPWGKKDDSGQVEESQWGKIDFPSSSGSWGKLVQKPDSVPKWGGNNKSQEGSDWSKNMEFPRNYRENYLRLLEIVTYGTHTDLGKRWSTKLWSNFAKELRKESDGNWITAFMCTEHLKGFKIHFRTTYAPPTNLHHFDKLGEKVSYDSQTDGWAQRRLWILSRPLF